MKIVIIEDENLTAKDLAKTIKAINPNFEIINILASVEEGIDYFNQKPEVDLIFSDIELGDGLSFEIFQQVNNQNPIIFCTAYNQYALDAFNNAGIDYILKPFSKTTVSKALEKYQNLKVKLSSKNQDYSSILNALKSQLQSGKMPSVLVHQSDKIIPIDGSEIAYFFIDNTTVYAFTFMQKTFVVTQQLDKLEEQFTNYYFRANRQFLINRKAVREASHHFNRKLQVHLTVPCKEQVLVGKLKVTSFLQWLSLS